MTGHRAFLPPIAAILLSSVTAGHAGDIRVPWIKQKTATECGRAVLASVAARHGGDAEKYYRELPAPPDRSRGFSILDVKNFGTNVGVDLSILQPDGITIAGECWSGRPWLPISPNWRIWSARASRYRRNQGFVEPRTLPVFGRRQCGPIHRARSKHARAKDDKSPLIAVDDVRLRLCRSRRSRLTAKARSWRHFSRFSPAPLGSRARSLPASPAFRCA